MGAPGRYARVPGVGRLTGIFRDASLDNPMQGSGTMTRVLLARQTAVPTGTEYLADRTSTNEGFGHSEGWGYRATATNLEARIGAGFGGGGAFVTLQHALPGIGALFAWALSWDGTTFRSRVLSDAQSTAPAQGDPSGGAGNFSVLDGASFSGHCDSFDVCAVFGTDVSAITDLATLLTAVRANVQQGRRYDDGLAAVSEWYWDGRDWPGYGTWVDRVSGAQLAYTAPVERIEHPGVCL